MTELEFTKQRLEDAIEAIDKLQAAQPVWSTNKPKVAGWYWYVRKFKDGKYGPIVLEVNDMGCVEIQGRWEKIGDNLGDIHGEWAGPLPLPREA